MNVAAFRRINSPLDQIPRTILAMEARPALVSPTEYLAQELVSQNRREYVAGSIYTVPDISRNHVEITGNLAFILGRELEARSCRNLLSGVKIRIAERDSYFYADASISCPPNFIDVPNGVIDNPTVLIEVLSPKTRVLNRGAKFAAYRTLDSLLEYVLIDSESVAIEVYSLEGEWKVRRFSSLDDIAFLPSVEVRIPLQEVYRHSEF